MESCGDLAWCKSNPVRIEISWAILAGNPGCCSRLSKRCFLTLLREKADLPTAAIPMPENLMNVARRTLKNPAGAGQSEGDSESDGPDRGPGTRHVGKV